MNSCKPLEIAPNDIIPHIFGGSGTRYISSPSLRALTTSAPNLTSKGPSCFVGSRVLFIGMAFIDLVSFIRFSTQDFCWLY